ncbi:MAG: magnesium transporter [Ruminococcaceae bacterium]|nr:magnesium transporter [Oscillospiraceae bacterium]
MNEYDFEELCRQALQLLEEKQYVRLRTVLDTMNAADIALVAEEVEEEALPLLFRILPKETAAEVFVEMDSETQELLIQVFSDRELKQVIDQMYLDDTVNLIEEMPANVVKRILRHTDPEMRKKINEVLQYPKDSAGSIMTIEYVDLKKDMTVTQAFEHIRKTGVDKETIYTCYVTEADRKLIGLVSVKTLLLAEDSLKLSDIMETNIISVNTLEDQETVVQQFDKYDFLAIPVVDGENRLVGIVTVDDAMDILREENSEDIAKMAAVTPTDKPYLKTSPFHLWKARVPWLLLLMISATFTGMIITSFENKLAACVALTAYIPMLMGTAGNSGNQASVTVIQGLSSGELKFSDAFRIMGKEAIVALLCGLTLAACNFAKMMLVDQRGIVVALVVSLTLPFIVICAKIVGSGLPILAKKLGFDPAVMASPFISTIMDSASLLIYFWVAGQFLML